MKKILKVYSGTDIVMCVPSHPLSQVMGVERLLNKIAASDENEFEVKVNSKEAVLMLAKCSDRYNIKLKFHVNGQPSSRDDVIKDLERGMDYINNF